MLEISAAAGGLGRAVLKALAVKGLSRDKFMIAVRRPENAVDLADKCLEIRRGDYDDPDSLREAFAGVTTLLFISGHAPNEERLRQHKNVVDAAKTAGVERVVYTSFANASLDSRFIFAKLHYDTEEYLKASGLNFTIVRNAFYADLTLEGIDETLASGKYIACAGEGRINSIPRDEIARALAEILMSEGHEGKTYYLTGPETFDYNYIAQMLAEVSGRRIEYENRSIEDARNFYGAGGGGSMPEYALEAMLTSYEAIEANEYDYLSEDFEKILGRKPQNLAGFLRENWPPPTLTKTEENS